MAGDTLRDAFRDELRDIVAAASPAIAWEVLDTLNTTEQPDASVGYFELEFLGGLETEASFGNPGADLNREEGQVTVRIVAPLGRNRDTAESYAETIRDAFRMRRITAGARTIRIDATEAMGGGHTEGGMWAEAVALSYSVLTTG